MAYEDTWEFYEDKASQWRWRRTASNGQCVGASSEGFASKDSAHNNARLVGYEDQFGTYDESCWKFYTDAKGEHRWKLTAKNGENVCSACEGYSAKEPCIANAQRHGYQKVAVGA